VNAVQAVWWAVVAAVGRFVGEFDPPPVPLPTDPPPTDPGG
jgi:hypothetical protein